MATRLAPDRAQIGVVGVDSGRLRLSHAFAWQLQIGLFKRALAIVGPKRRDYSGDQPFRNFYASEQFGVAPWRGTLVRLSDKLSRLCRLAEQGGSSHVEDESLLDTAADALNYVAIAVGLILEAVPEDLAQALLETATDWAEGPWPADAPIRRHSNKLLTTRFTASPVHVSGTRPPQYRLLRSRPDRRTTRALP